MQKIYDRHGCVSANGLLKMMDDAADKCDACHEAMADEVERLRELLDAERDANRELREELESHAVYASGLRSRAQGMQKALWSIRVCGMPKAEVIESAIGSPIP